MQKVLVLVNKSWEADPLVAVARNGKLRPPVVSADSISEFGGQPNPVKPKPRCKIELAAASIEIWCVEDWTEGSNRSRVKMLRALPVMRDSAHDPDLVVAVGTAAFPDAETKNGCVFIGSETFLFNPYDTAAPVSHDPAQDWVDTRLGHVVRSEAGSRIVKELEHDCKLREEINKRLLQTPLNAASAPLVLADGDAVGLSVVNVTDPNDYVWADELALRSFKQAASHGIARSVETTHGLIRLTWEGAPFVFVSGIVNRLGHFNEDVAPRVIAQNFVAAHNAGIATMWLLSSVMT
jgi:hypothetical protein